MYNAENLTSINMWLAELREYFISTEPDILYLFDTYADEALYGRNYIASDLKHLHPGARVLEVGAGSLLLSSQLVREGFDVTAIEPFGHGFSHFIRMQQLILKKSAASGCLPNCLSMMAEDFSEHNSYDFAFSINSMEHVYDIERVIVNIKNSLHLGANYHFTCPNYLFPYEPHFNIPIILSKSLTKKILYRKIVRSKMPDPSGVWESLNWITINTIKNIVRKHPDIEAVFNKRILESTLERIVHDKTFASRRSPAVSKIISFLVQIKIHKLGRLIPAIFQPNMDCKLHKRAECGCF